MNEARQKVLFVCVGNACRSQMAEAFAHAYGSDVLEPSSAGLTPAVMIPVLTLDVMEEKNIPLDGQFPKGLDTVQPDSFSLIVNLSGRDLPGKFSAPVRKWDVSDPMGQKKEYHRQVRDQIEMKVMSLILELRKRASR
jgi:arsenate reductase (thioredoxin)